MSVNNECICPMNANLDGSTHLCICNSNYYQIASNPMICNPYRCPGYSTLDAATETCICAGTYLTVVSENPLICTDATALTGFTAATNS